MTRPAPAWTLPLLLLLLATACGGDGATQNPLNTANLSSTEITALANALSSSASSVSSSASASADMLPANGNVLALPGGSAPANANTITVPLNSSVNCPVGGRVSYTGDLIDSYTTSNTGAITSWNLTAAITFNYGDPTNNLYDCQVTSNLVLDGTLNFILSGDNTSGIGWSLNGTIEVDQPVNGGLSPRGSCLVAIGQMKGATTVTGSVCGQSIN